MVWEGDSARMRQCRRKLVEKMQEEDGEDNVEGRWCGKTVRKGDGVW